MSSDYALGQKRWPAGHTTRKKERTSIFNRSNGTCRKTLKEVLRVPNTVNQSDIQNELKCWTQSTSRLCFRTMCSPCVRAHKPLLSGSHYQKGRDDLNH
ncbi:hypothetical protein BaRGS_00000442 [Batillaria attramentaria]|uniref:Uncharacterized protein n=1 Tax=Batillaria attramentaria TaxID=370345 RepID=A0ABD0MAH4_9CAEN